MRWPTTVLSKLYLFTTEFKKWDQVVFLDADIIVRASLEDLTNINGFAAHEEGPLSVRLDRTHPLLKTLKKKYDIKSKALCGSIFAFSTDIIKKNTFSELKNLLKRYEPLIRNDESILNLFFYKNYQKIPESFNVGINYLPDVKPRDIKGIIIHFAMSLKRSEKPWFPESYFYKEWKNNLEKAELIDIDKILPPHKIWTKKEIMRYSLFLRMEGFKNKLLDKIDRYIGLIGIVLKKISPKLYNLLKDYNLKRRNFK